MDSAVDVNEATAPVADPWVIWRQNRAYNFGLHSELQRLIAVRPQERGHTEHIVVSHLQENLFSFLNTERENRTKLFCNRGRLPLIDFFPWMVSQICLMFFHITMFPDRNPLNVCCEVMAHCLEIFERGMAGNLRSFSSAWPRKFAEVLRQDFSFINGMDYQDALLIAHMRMLIFIQDGTRYLEMRHGRLHEPSIAESYAVVFAQTYPSLYAKFMAPMFAPIIYGRRAMVPLVVEDDGLDD